MVLPGCLVKEYTNTANADPPAREEKGIQLTATIQTVTKDSFIRQWRLLGLKKTQLFQRQGIIKDILKLQLAVFRLLFLPDLAKWL